MKYRIFETVQTEIQREKAEALGRAGERLEQVLRDLETTRQELLRLVGDAKDDDPREKAELTILAEEKWAMYSRLWEQAREIRHSLIIQREAVGLWRHEDVERQYPTPARLALSKLCPWEDCG